MLSTTGRCCLLALSFMFAGSAVSQDATEFDSLRKELTALREELSAVRKERDALKQELAELRRNSNKAEPSSEPKDSEGAFNGIHWEISALNAQNVAVLTTTFYAQDGKIFKEGVQIGTYVDAGNQARMDITNPEAPKANGVYKLLRIKNEPAVYNGTFENKDGARIKVLLKALVN